MSEPETTSKLPIEAVVEICISDEIPFSRETTWLAQAIGSILRPTISCVGHFDRYELERLYGTGRITGNQP
jgi:hypothetical protein